MQHPTTQHTSTGSWTSWQSALQVLQSQLEEARSCAAASEQDGQALTELSAQLRTWEARCTPHLCMGLACIQRATDIL